MWFLPYLPRRRGPMSCPALLHRSKASGLPARTRISDPHLPDVKPPCSLAGPRARRFFLWRGRSSSRIGRHGRRGAVPDLRPEPLALEVLVEVGDVFGIAVEQLGRHPLVGAEHALGRLAPARMRHLRIDVGPEAVLAGLQLFPVADRALL